jgi:AraC-like DNA-binding protein
LRTAARDQLSIAQPVAADEAELGLLICQAGDITIRVGSDVVMLQDGEAVLVARNEVGPVDEHHGRLLAIWIPRDRLVARVTDIDGLVMRRLPAQTPALARLAEHAAALLHQGSLAPVAGHPDAALVYIHDLVALTLNASRGDDDIKARDGLGAIRLIAAKLHIVDNSFRKNLSIKALALQLGVTTRYIQRLFEIDGTTFSIVLLDHRLNSAYRILLDSRYRKRPVSAIAYDVGFGDLSYFNRCFRRRFGETPSAIRQAVMAEPTSDGAGLD